jgi:hypothetical protein
MEESEKRNGKEVAWPRGLSSLERAHFARWKEGASSS